MVRPEGWQPYKNPNPVGQAPKEKLLCLRCGRTTCPKRCELVYSCDQFTDRATRHLPAACCQAPYRMYTLVQFDDGVKDRYDVCDNCGKDCEVSKCPHLATCPRHNTIGQVIDDYGRVKRDG